MKIITFYKAKYMVEEAKKALNNEIDFIDLCVFLYPYIDNSDPEYDFMMHIVYVVSEAGDELEHYKEGLGSSISSLLDNKDKVRKIFQDEYQPLFEVCQKIVLKYEDVVKSKEQYVNRRIEDILAEMLVNKNLSEEQKKIVCTNIRIEFANSFADRFVDTQKDVQDVLSDIFYRYFRDYKQLSKITSKRFSEVSI